MVDNIVKFKLPIPTAYETTGDLKDLIKRAEDCVQYLEENSVGYYYYWMLHELKKLKGN